MRLIYFEEVRAFPRDSNGTFDMYTKTNRAVWKRCAICDELRIKLISPIMAVRCSQSYSPSRLKVPHPILFASSGKFDIGGLP